MSRSLHIVALDAPSPPDYGGAIDIYYKVRALAETGWKIKLHYFNYKKGRSAEGLEQYCSELHAYKRKSVLKSFSFGQPYIIASRVDKKLVDRLNEKDDPVLLEGLHCSGILPLLHHHERVILRMHNDEAVYYSQLARVEKNLAKKIYLGLESRLLRRYMLKLENNIQLACLSRTDVISFSEKYGKNRGHFIPCFLPWQEVKGKEGKGDYCLYHGNMAVPENEAAAGWLMEKVFAGSRLKLVIAGKGISKRLQKMKEDHPMVSLVSDPSMEELNELVREAHLHVLPSMNTTGVKLKLLHALFEGRFCLVNSQGVEGSGAAEWVNIADEPGEFRRIAEALMESEFTEEEKKNRQGLLTVYNNLDNAKRLSALW